MAKIKYTGPVTPMNIPGVGVVGKDWTPCPDDIAAQFQKEPGFEVELAPPSASSAVKKNSGGVK